LFLLDSLARILKQAPEARVVIAGDGEIRPAVEAKIRELGLGSSVMFLGERNDMPMILAALDVFCLPSETEGMPVTVLEAMAASLPIIASDVGGIPQLIEDGVSGILFPITNLAKLDELLLEARNNPGRARGMGKVAQARVERDFSLERVLKDYEDLYAEAVTSK
jgi:glycosyltransferase involved in cell wall biosynthesis